MTYQIFETGSGRFLPLTDEQLGMLSEPAAVAYTEVAGVVDEMALLDAEVASAKAQLTADVETLAEVERNTPKFDPEAARVALVKEMIATNRAARGF